MSKKTLLILLSIVIAIPYALSGVIQVTSKGWHDERLKNIAEKLAANTSTRSLMTVNTAQQYSTGCSSIVFEVYTKGCFAVQVWRLKTDKLAVESYPNEEVLAEARGTMCKELKALLQQVIDGPKKGVINFYESTEIIHSDGSSSRTHKLIDHCLAEVP